MNYFLMLVILMLAISCNTNKKPKNRAVVSEIDLSAVKKNKTLLLSDIIDTVRYIPLETTKKALIKGTEKIILFKGKFYLQDSREKSIFIFLNNGKFLNKINRVGKGPGEYYKIDDFIIDEEEETVEIYNRQQQKIFKFDLEGKFLNEVKVFGIVANSFAKLDNDKYAFFIPHPSDSPFKLIVADENGQIYHKYFEFSEYDNPRKIMTHYFSKYGEVLSFLEWPGDTAYSVNSSGITPKYHFTFSGEYGPQYYTENESYVTFMFPDREYKAFTSFYSKATKTLITTLNIINDINGVPFRKPITTSGAEFISVVNAYSFKEIFLRDYETLEKYVPEKELTNLKGFIIKINANDNPVVVMSKFKSF